MRTTGAGVVWVARALGIALVIVGCDDPRSSAPAPRVESAEERATREVKAYVDAQVAELARAAADLCAAAPTPDEDGWSIERDRAAVLAMRAAWSRARDAYERVEGAIAILFPHYDRTLDGRYEHEVELRADTSPFDDTGFVGMHAIERILYSDAHASAVVAFERALPHYEAARVPRDRAEAEAFRDRLCARLARETREMQAELAPLALDPATAWRGVVGSIEEQAEKVRLGATGQDESRYADRTLADMRANLAGGRAVIAAFGPRLAETSRARELVERVEGELDVLERAYGEGDALPAVPEGWNPDSPTPEHRQTAYGRLHALLETASDPRDPESIAAALRSAGEAMGIPPLAR